ncbi:MAG: hypothetical protein ACON38_18485 [Akkermansiaceae bacterium]
MTDKQFHVLRNLLTWIVVCLLLLISHSFGMIRKQPVVEFIGVACNYLVLIFLFFMGCRSMIIVFKDDEKTPAQAEEETPST